MTTTKKDSKIKTDLKFFSCKFEKELHVRLLADAKDNRRPLNQHVMWICEQYLKSLDKEG
jgi:hypothetical protein